MKKQKLFTRNFTFLLLGQISSLIGNYTLKFALSMYVLEQTGSASIFATLLAIAMLPTILLSPFGGILADRANRRNIMVGLDTLSGCTVLVAGLVLPFGHDIWVIGALLVILSVLAAFESPTVQACIPQMLSGDNLMKGNAAVNQVQAIAGLITPFLGSLVYAAFGLTPVLWGTVACFFLTAILECFIRLDYLVTETGYTPEELRDILVSSGWDGAIMLDGGGSVCYLDREGKKIACDPDRVLPYYIVAFLKEDEVNMSGTASNVLKIAEKEVGYKESPVGSNKTKYGKWYGLDGYAWCVMFVQWVFDQASVSLPARTASCTVLRNYAKKANMWVTGDYRPGDVVIYDWGGDGVPDHCGIVKNVGTSTLTAIEGNTAVGNDSNGGEVMIRERKLSQVMGAVRPEYEPEPTETDDKEDKEMVRYQKLSDIQSVTFRTIIEKLMNAGIIQGDGSDPDGNDDVIDLSHDQVRLLVFAYRGGAFDARLKAAGLEPAVQ